MMGCLASAKRDIVDSHRQSRLKVVRHARSRRSRRFLNDEPVRCGQSKVVSVVDDFDPHSTAFSAPPTSPAASIESAPSSVPSLGVLGLFILSAYESGGKQVTVSTGKKSFGGQPQPLPVPQEPTSLPLAQEEEIPTSSSSSSEMRILSGTGSFVSTSWSSPLVSSSSITGVNDSRPDSSKGRPMPVAGVYPHVPQPLPSPSVAMETCLNLRAFTFKELATAAGNFSPEHCIEEWAYGTVYEAWICQSNAGEERKRKVAVLRLSHDGLQGVKDWRAEVQMLAQLKDRYICKLRGYCEDDLASSDIGGSTLTKARRSRERLLVYDQLCNGSLGDYLFGSLMCQNLLDWTIRMNIALQAALGMAYIHERAPQQIVYRNFSISSIQLDKDFKAKLAGFGLCVISQENDKITKKSRAFAKKNIWSFGVVLLELLTGKHGRDAAFPKAERDFVQWAKPFLEDDAKLTLIIDSQLRGRYPWTGAQKVAGLALQCLNKDAKLRPSITEVVDVLNSIKDLKHGDELLLSDFKKSKSLKKLHHLSIIRSSFDNLAKSVREKLPEDNNRLFEALPAHQ